LIDEVAGFCAPDEFRLASVIFGEIVQPQISAQLDSLLKCERLRHLL
jgi:hypothetical protein